MTIFAAPISVADVGPDFQNDFFELSEDILALQVRFALDFLQAMVLPQHLRTGYQGEVAFNIVQDLLFLGLDGAFGFTYQRPPGMYQVAVGDQLLFLQPAVLHAPARGAVIMAALNRRVNAPLTRSVF